MKKTLALCLLAFGAFGTFSLSSCGDGTTNQTDPPPPETPTYSIGGNLTGLAGGSVVLQLNGQEDLAVNAAGAFTFNTKIQKGNTYAVTVKTQPAQPPQTCLVVSGTGTATTANITSVLVTCDLTKFPVGGIVAGLGTATGLVLQNNGADDLAVQMDGAFAFQTPIAVGGNYAVTISTQPQGRICAIASGTEAGTVGNGPVTSVVVNCTVPTSCKAIKDAMPSATDGDYTIDPDGGGSAAPLTVFCDMTTDGGGYTYYPIKSGGISTTRYDQQNSCTAVGLKMVVARTKAHMTAMWSKYGASYFATVPGVYGLAAGNYTSCVMNSKNTTCGANWRAIDGGAWWARDTTYGEPNGDYTPGCWLGGGGLYDNGQMTFNDLNCGYSTGATYLCSDNAKP